MPRSSDLDILYVIGALDIGGTERHLSGVARALAARGLRIGVYSLAGDGPLRAELESAGVTVIRPFVGRGRVGSALLLRVGRMVLGGLHLGAVMLRRRPRLVHFFLPAAYLVGGAAASVARIRIQVMSRRSLNDYQRGYPLVRRWEMRLHRGMSVILANSCAVLRQLHDEEQVPQEKLGLIYNGVDLAAPVGTDTRARTRAALEMDADTLTLIIVANLIPYKGHCDLIAALTRVADAMPPKWQLLVVGRDDGAGPAIAEQAREAGLASHVSLLGARRDIPDLLAASDLAILASHQEGFSNAVLEAMAAGLPLVVTDVGGNAEAVLDEETGLVVPSRDPARMGTAILRLVRDPHLRQRFGGAGRERAARLFSQAECVARYDALYRGLVKGLTPSAVVKAMNAGGRLR